MINIDNEWYKFDDNFAYKCELKNAFERKSQRVYNLFYEKGEIVS